MTAKVGTGGGGARRRCPRTQGSVPMMESTRGQCWAGTEGPAACACGEGGARTLWEGRQTRSLLHGEQRQRGQVRGG